MSRLGVKSPGGSVVSHGRAATGSVTPAASANVAVTLTPAMADTDFTASAMVLDAANDLRVLNVVSVTATTVTVRVNNSDALNSASGTVYVLAVHD